MIICIVLEIVRMKVIINICIQIIFILNFFILLQKYKKRDIDYYTRNYKENEPIWN